MSGAPTTAEHTPGPWYALDQRASTLRRQGWVGEPHDKILISNYAPADIHEGHCDCIVARIDLSNRVEELGEGNMADARLIAAAPDLLEALHLILPLAKGYAPEGQTPTARRTCKSWIEAAEAAIAKAVAS